MSQHQVLAEDAYDVIQDAIDVLEELSDAAGEEEEEEEEEEGNDDDQDKTETVVKNTSCEGQANTAADAAAAAAAENPTTSSQCDWNPSPESELQEQQSSGINSCQPDQIQPKQPILRSADECASIVQVSGSVSSAPEPPEAGFFGLLNEPEWGLLWIMGLLSTAPLGLMTAMALSEDCGCGIMACSLSQ
jgi:hypothetical protein